MANSKNKFTFKIILSYLVLGTLSVLVGVFLLSEFKNYTAVVNESKGEKKFIETGTLINLVYATDGFSRLALLTESDADFEKYSSKNDSLFKKIEEIKSLTTNRFQIIQLDSVKWLLQDKNRNIEQLRILRLTNQKDTSLDDIMREVRKLESSVGLSSVESLVQNPSKLSLRERRVYQSYADYLNSNNTRDTSTVKSKTVDSMLTASRYIVAEAKKENSRIRESLMQKENELIRNDLKISERLREIITSFDNEITKNDYLEKEKRSESMNRTGEILKFAGILGGIVVFLFSYFILSDFFRAERFKKNLEESKDYAETLLKSREQLLSTVSHDLKTPLNTISGYSELFGNSSLTEKQKSYLEQITSSSHFISHLVDDLLDYSKLEAGKLPLESIPFSLENIIIEAGNAVKQVYPEKPIELNIIISEKIKNQIFESDPLRIRQIINNLIGNAFKFTEKGSVEIRVDKLSKKDEGSTVQISIIDTGIGISQEKQQLIFNEFTQADNDIAHKFGGSGLGLAISKKLTELLGGKLKVASVLNEGSTFILTLPLKLSERILPKINTETIDSFDGLKAIVIDDDEAMRSLLKETFEQLGVAAKTFGSYSKFESASERLDFDFVLTDIQMPDTDGFTVLKYLKDGTINSYKNQPVLAMTGSREHSRDFYFEKGFSELLSKPFSRHELISALKMIFPLVGKTLREQESLDKDETTSFSSNNFDLSLLNSFVSSPNALEEVISIFYEQTEKDLIQIKQSIANKDLGAIQEITHRMLTMFRQLKAKNIIPILERIEDYSEKEYVNFWNAATLQMDYEKLCMNYRELQRELARR